MTIKTYTVARIDADGIELIDTKNYLTKRQAREIRVAMQRKMRPNKYVVVNLATHINPERDITV